MNEWEWCEVVLCTMFFSFLFFQCIKVQNHWTENRRVSNNEKSSAHKLCLEIIHIMKISGILMISGSQLLLKNDLINFFFHLVFVPSCRNQRSDTHFYLYLYVCFVVFSLSSFSNEFPEHKNVQSFGFILIIISVFSSMCERCCADD